LVDNFLCLLATFDQKTSFQMKDIAITLKEAGFQDKQTPDLPHHITMAYFDTSLENEIKQLLEEVSSRTKKFDLTFNHIGLFGLKVMFLAPNVNYELLDLHKGLEMLSNKEEWEWTPHATILIEEEDSINKALPLVNEKFHQINGRIERLRLYEFFPARLVAEYELL
jgi:2'-5' RNA ligase